MYHWDKQLRNQKYQIYFFSNKKQKYFNFIHFCVKMEDPLCRVYWILPTKEKNQIRDIFVVISPQKSGEIEFKPQFLRSDSKEILPFSSLTLGKENEMV
jgi:hypothetical protein